MSYSKQSLAKRYFFSKTSQSAEDYTAFWIRYKPERLNRQRLKRPGAKLILSLTILATAIIGAGMLFLQQSLVGYSLIASAIYMTFSTMTGIGPWKLIAPTHIELSDKGLQFHWLHLLYQLSTPLLSWDRISHVTTVNTTVNKTEEITIEFNAIARGIPLKKRLAYFVLAPVLTWGWLSSDRALIRFEVDAIASSDDRKRLQLALKKFLPSYRIEPKVADDLNMYIRQDSYTDLWLDKLQDGSSRQRDSALEAGTELAGGGYKVISHIGAGGQALVYLASMHRELPDGAGLDGKKGETLVDFSDLPIAIESGEKTELPEVVLKEFVLPAQAGVNIRKRVLDNIQREAKLWKKLRHPNIVRLLDFFVEDQRAYLVLEHAEGTTLKDVVTTSGIMPEQKVVQLAIQMCDILSYLHRRQPSVVHRDFTPDNLIMDQDEKLKLIDFNVAQQLEAQTTKTVVGKHSYIPPEQFRGKAIPQSDIYALGATLDYLLTGKDPEPISQARPRRLRPEISTSLDEIVAKCTSLGLSTRYQDCQSLKSDLLTLVQEQQSPPE